MIQFNAVLLYRPEAYTELNNCQSDVQNVCFFPDVPDGHSHEHGICLFRGLYLSVSLSMCLYLFVCVPLSLARVRALSLSFALCLSLPVCVCHGVQQRSEERRVGKECRL